MKEEHAQVVARGGLSVPPRKRRFAISRQMAMRFGVPAVLLLLFMVLWELIISVFSLEQYILPRPREIIASFQGEWGELFHHTKLTALEAFLGYVLGNSIAFVLAAFMAEFKVLEIGLYPYVLLLRSLPIIAIAPLLILWFGFTIWPIVFAAALIVFFPTLVNGIEGFKATDATTLELMRGLNANRWQTFRMVKLPYAVPYIFAALKIAVASALVGAIVGEWISADEGLGFLTILANNYVDTLLLFRAVLMIAFIAILWFGIVSALEHRFVKWQRPASDRA